MFDELYFSISESKLKNYLILKSSKNIMYTFAILTIKVNVYIIFLPDFNSV